MNATARNRTKEIVQTLCVALSVLVLSLAMSMVDARQREIRFAKGETATTIRSEWRGENEVYTFRAKKGQRISIRLDDGRAASTKLRLTLYKYCGDEYGEPLANEVVRFDGVLPCSDQFSFDIMPGSDLALKVDQIEYVLWISIK